ncbi:MAG: hypothetical protein RL354_1689 [Planctomycetota bacterium]
MNPRTQTARIARSLRTLACCALPVLWLAGCSFDTASSKTQIRQSVEGAKSVVAATENGSVELVQDASATTMQISADVRCTAATAAEAETRVKATKLVAERDASGNVRVGVEFPPRGTAASFLNMGQSDSARIVIRAATLEGIEVTTTNGSIDVGAFRGNAKLATSNGSIVIDGHAGPVEARSSNGAIRASGVLAPIVAETSNGRIEVSLAAAAQGDVHLETSNGSVSLELGESWQGTVSADTSNGKVDLSGGDVVERVGSKRMTIGDAAKANATIDTSNGRITVRAAKK